ncbi:MAG: hypothetical protein COZ12_08765, partial [Deltaproteobacteria bacterium CG_4_10_14_3_um_filter_60_8]
QVGFGQFVGTQRDMLGMVHGIARFRDCFIADQTRGNGAKFRKMQRLSGIGGKPVALIVRPG